MVVLVGPARQTLLHLGDPARPVVYATHRRDGKPVIQLGILEYGWGRLGMTVVTQIPAGFRHLQGKVYPTFADAAQETHSMLFGSPTEYWKSFEVYLLGPLDPTVLAGCPSGNLPEAMVAAHVRSRVECAATDACGTGVWLKVSLLVPLVPPSLTLSEAFQSIREGAYTMSRRGKKKRRDAAAAAAATVDGAGVAAAVDAGAGGSTGMDAPPCNRRRWSIGRRDGNVLWSRDAALPPRAWVVRGSRYEGDLRGSTNLELGLESIPVGDGRALEWRHVNDLANFQELLPQIWERRCLDPAAAAATDEVVLRALEQLHVLVPRRSTYELWTQAMGEVPPPPGLAEHAAAVPPAATVPPHVPPAAAASGSGSAPDGRRSSGPD